MPRTDRRILGGAGAAGAAGAAGSQILSGAGVPSDATGANGDVYIRTNGLLYAKAAGSWAAITQFVPMAAANAFNLVAAGAGEAVVPADLNVGSLSAADIPGIITAIGTLQTGINTNRHLLVTLIGLVKAAA